MTRRFLTSGEAFDALRAMPVDGKALTVTGSQLHQLGIWVMVSFTVADWTFRFAEAKRPSPSRDSITRWDGVPTEL